MGGYGPRVLVIPPWGARGDPGGHPWGGAQRVTARVPTGPQTQDTSP